MGEPGRRPDSEWRVSMRNRCEARTPHRAKSGRVYQIWCENTTAPDARERIGELGALLCAKHAAEREKALR
jgi:hypothetical protein